jgi:protein disulfide-isomerase-like protein
MWIFFVVKCLALLNIAKCSDIVTLSSDNFEHDTQASSGSTTGPWLLKFYAPWCGHCKVMAPVMEELASDLLGQVNVADIDVTQNRDLGRRFNITGFPTLKFMHQGKTYDYKGPRTFVDMKEFVTSGYKTHEGYTTPVSKGYFEDLFEQFFGIYIIAINDIKKGNYFSQSALFALFPILMVLIVFAGCFVPGDSHEEKKSK